MHRTFFDLSCLPGRPRRAADPLLRDAVGSAGADEAAASRVLGDGLERAVLDRRWSRRSSRLQRRCTTQLAGADMISPGLSKPGKNGKVFRLIIKDTHS
jgi:hypothetical protein